MVRAPRFEPGSSAWQADVLDQTRLRALGTSVNPITDKNLTTQTEGKIANTLIQLKANGRTAEQTIKRIATNLTRLVQQCNLDNPEEVARAPFHLRTKVINLWTLNIELCEKDFLADWLFNHDCWSDTYSSVPNARGRSCLPVDKNCRLCSRTVDGL